MVKDHFPTPSPAPSRGHLMQVRAAAMALRNAQVYADHLKQTTCSARDDRRIPLALADVEGCIAALDKALAKSGDFCAAHRVEQIGGAA